jgi:hypothetical protein
MITIKKMGALSLIYLGSFLLCPTYTAAGGWINRCKNLNTPQKIIAGTTLAACAAGATYYWWHMPRKTTSLVINNHEFNICMFNKALSNYQKVIISEVQESEDIEDGTLMFILKEREKPVLGITAKHYFANSLTPVAISRAQLTKEITLTYPDNSTEGIIIPANAAPNTKECQAKQLYEHLFQPHEDTLRVRYHRLLNKINNKKTPDSMLISMGINANSIPNDRKNEYIQFLKETNTQKLNRLEKLYPDLQWQPSSNE